LGGVLAAGLLLGRPGNEGIIPSEWVSGLVGGNSLAANFFSAIVGAFMYFATLTEVPILQGLIGSGMGNGPALALLLAGPALSLPKYAGHPERHGNEEDGGLREPGRGHVHPLRHDLRSFLPWIDRSGARYAQAT